MTMHRLGKMTKREVDKIEKYIKQGRLALESNNLNKLLKVLEKAVTIVENDRERLHKLKQSTRQTC